MSEGWPVPRRFAAALMLLVVAGALLRVVPLMGPIDVIDGRTIPDDAYLSATIAQSIGWGRGPMYGDEATNGFQPLHVLLAAPLWAGDSDEIRAAPSTALLDLRVRQAIGIAVVFDLLSILLIAALLGCRYGRGGEALAGAAVWALHPTVVRTALNGLETSVATALVLAALLVWQTRVRSRSSVVWWAALGALLGLAALARIDATILVACAMLLEYAGARRRGSSVARSLTGPAVLLGAAIAVYLPYLTWSWRWTGAAFPISGEAVRLNALSWNARQGLGALFWLRSVGSCLGSIGWINAPVLFPASVVAVALAWRSRRRGGAGSWGSAMLTDLASWPLGLGYIAALFVAYTMWVLAWWFNDRYLFVAMLVPIFVVAAGLRALRGSRWRPRLLAAVVVLCAVHPLHWGVWSAHPDPDLGYRQVGLWATEHFEPGTTIGSCQTGALHYYNPGLQVRNLDGVVSPSALRALKERRTVEHLHDRDVQTLVAWRGCVRYLAARSQAGDRRSFRELRSVPGFRSWNRTWRIFRVEPPPTAGD